MTNAVQILIERLKTHPDDFFGAVGEGHRVTKYGYPKFAGVERKLNDLVAEPAVREKNAGRANPYWFLEPEELATLIDAYKDASRKRFDAEIVHLLLAPEPEPVQYQAVIGNGSLVSNYNTTIAPQSLEAEARQADLNARMDSAMRNTKPFKFSI